MDEVLVPTIYVQRLNNYLAGGDLAPLLMLFDESAVIERYVHGEPPRIYAGIEQIEESLLHLPPTGGCFRVVGVRIEGEAVHARFFTRGFPYPLRGMYRFELTSRGQIAHLWIAARYCGPRR
jgi:hypothetical protein